jgi:hypothetical protein
MPARRPVTDKAQKVFAEELLASKYLSPSTDKIGSEKYSPLEGCTKIA